MEVNVKCKTVKLFEKKGKLFGSLELGKDFLDFTPKT